MGYRLPFFPMYAAETLADGRFQGWNIEERGAWLTFLLANWNDGDIPASQTELARMIRVGSGDMARIWSAIGDRFVEVPSRPGRLWSPRLEEERDKAESLSRKRSVVGKKGATARWNTGKRRNGKGMRLPMPTHSPGIAEAMPPQCPQPSPSQSPSQEKQIPPTHARARLVSPFGEADPYPKTTAVLNALFERGIDTAPPSAVSASRVEAAIVAVGVEAAAGRAGEAIAATGKKPLTFHVEAIRAEKQATPELPAPDPSWLASLGARRADAEEEWRTASERIRHAAYPDALPRLLAAERDALVERFSEAL